MKTFVFVFFFHLIASAESNQRCESVFPATQETLFRRGIDYENHRHFFLIKPNGNTLINELAQQLLRTENMALVIVPSKTVPNGTPANSLLFALPTLDVLLRKAERMTPTLLNRALKLGFASARTAATKPSGGEEDHMAAEWERMEVAKDIVDSSN